MTFQGFEQKDFDTFSIDGLEARMEAIQNRIQPKFQEIGSELVDYLSFQLGNEVYLHIAKHARRTVNPPNDTWLAIADNKRGYKKHPHFQIGLFDDHVFIWLALIYELDYKRSIAESFVASFDEIKELPNHYVISLDHMKKDAISLDNLKLQDVERFRDVKKCEFLIGQHFSPDDERVSDGDKFLETAKNTFDSLIPLYQKALRSRT
ncbi:YktB family protein [Virgibacillus oceani]